MSTVAEPRRRRFGTRLRRHRGDDRGASLILALAFILVVGLIAGALLSVTSTSLRTQPVYDDKALAAFEVDGALNASVNAVRNSTFAFDGATPKCTSVAGFDATSTMFVPSTTSAGGRIAVTCEPGQGTGALSNPVVINAGNKPGNAILTLNPTSVTSEPGLEISQRLLTVQGRVFSNSTILQNGSACPATPQPPTNSNCVELYSKVLNWPVIAKGACTGGRIVSTPAAQCNATGPFNGYDLDPNYAQPASPLASLVPQTFPTCPNGTATLTLSPGYYDDATELNDWTDGSCSGNKTVRLLPGTYFFDFHNAEMPAGKSAAATAVPRAGDIWRISGSNVTVVGGTLAPGISIPIPSAKIPGACVNPLDSNTAQGVQLVFGGDSRIEYERGKVELCGSYSSTGSPVVIYGAKQDSPSVTTPPADVVPSPGATTGSSGFSRNSGNGTLLAPLTTAGDNSFATATITRPNGQGQTGTATLALGTWTLPAGSLPVGSILTSATLQLVHRESVTLTNQRNENQQSSDTLTVSVRQTTGSNTTVLDTEPVTPTTGATPGWATTAVDLTDGFAKLIHDTGGTSTFTGLTLRLDAAALARVTGNTQWKVDVDQAVLTLKYAYPGVRANTTPLGGAANCLGTIPYVPSRNGSATQNCALLAATQAGHDDETNLVGRFFVQGTVYAPLAAVELLLPKQNKQAVRSGLIARSVRVNVRQEDGNGNDNPGQVSIEVPNDSVGKLPVDVYFSAYVCPTGSTCTGSPPGSNWRLAGTARASYVDPGPVPVPGSRQVVVKTWQVTR